MIFWRQNSSNNRLCSSQPSVQISSPHHEQIVTLFLAERFDMSAKIVLIPFIWLIRFCLSSLDKKDEVAKSIPIADPARRTARATRVVETGGLFRFLFWSLGDNIGCSVIAAIMRLFSYLYDRREYLISLLTEMAAYSYQTQRHVGEVSRREYGSFSSPWWRVAFCSHTTFGLCVCWH